jgi:hypothetical protein
MFRTLLVALLGAALAFTQVSPPKLPLDPGTYDPAIHLYRNRALALTLKVPYGWVDRTKQMNPDPPDPAKGSVLLAVFERPPEASNSSLNPTILIAAEPVSSYPGLKAAADYYVPLKEVTSAKGLEPAGDPYDFSMGPRKLLRADFTHKTDQGTSYQSTVIFLAHSNIISITAIAATEDDATQLLSGLNFTSPTHP